MKFGKHDAIGITGTRGVGKTTLARAIIGHYKAEFGYKLKWASPKDFSVEAGYIVVFDDWTNWSEKDRYRVADYLNRSAAMLRHIGASMLVITHHPSILPKLFRFSLDRVFIGRTPSHAGYKYIIYWVGKHPEVKNLPDYQFLYWDTTGDRTLLLTTHKAGDQLDLEFSPLSEPGKGSESPDD